MKNFKKKIEGKSVELIEVSAKYFENIIKWRNNPQINHFLNQPFELTMELQEKWFRGYKDSNDQCMYIILDKIEGVPFGTIGFTNFDSTEKSCIMGRFLVGEEKYLGSVQLTEAMLILYDYLFDELQLNETYCHVVIDNKKVINYHKRWGYIQTETPKFPQELFVNNMNQIEMIRNKVAYDIYNAKIRKVVEQVLR